MPSLEAAGAEATDKSVAPGSGWTGPRRRRRPLTAINPTHHGRRSGPGTGPAPSGEQKLRNGGGDGSNFLALTLTFPTSEQATFKKKKKNPLTELCSGSRARTALDPPPATTAFFSASDSSPAERAAAGGGDSGGGGGGGGSRGSGGSPRPLRRGGGKGGGNANPAPGQSRPIGLKDLLGNNPHIQSEPEEWAYVNGWDVAEKGRNIWTVSTPRSPVLTRGDLTDWPESGRTELHSIPQTLA